MPGVVARSCRKFIQSIEQPALVFCGSFLVNLMSSDVSSLLQNQSFVLMRFIPYISMFTMIMLFYVTKHMIEVHLPQDTGRPGPQIIGHPDSHHTGRPGRPGLDDEDRFLFDYISLIRRCLVENDHDLRFLFHYIRRCVMENDDDLQHLVNYTRRRSLENGSNESRDPAPASASPGLRAIQNSSQAQLGTSSRGAVECNSQAQPGSPCNSLAQPTAQSTDVVLTIGTKEPVTDVEEVYQPREMTKGSKILHRRLEIGPQTGHLELDNLRLQIIESMRRAQIIDKDCTLQIGSFVVLKYTVSGPKWWKLQKHWTPTISSVRRSPRSLFDLLFGWSSHWTIRGFNLQAATLRASTLDKSENLKILQHYKARNGEDVLLCEESYLIQSSAPMFQEKVYICASNFVEVEEEVTFNLQSEAKNVKKAYWMSVVEGLVPSPWTMIMIASLSFLGGLSKGTHGTGDHGFLSKVVSNNSFNVGLKGSSVLLDIWREFFRFFLVYMFTIVTPIFGSILWLLSHERVPPGYDGPALETTAALDYVTSNCNPTCPTHREDIVLDDVTNDSPSPTTPPPSQDIFLEDITSTMGPIPSPVVEEIMLEDVTTTSPNPPPIEDILLEDITIPGHRTPPAVEVTLLEDGTNRESRSSMEDITRLPSSRPVEDSTGNPSPKPPPVVDNLRETDIGVLQESWSESDIREIFSDTFHRWLLPVEVYAFLRNFKLYDFKLSPEPPIKPQSGSIYLFNGRDNPDFREDGHNWRKTKDGKTVREVRERLKVGNVHVLDCYYAHGEENPNFQRRTYWMLDTAYERLVLVHYLEVTKPPQFGHNSMDPVSATTFMASPDAVEMPGTSLSPESENVRGNQGRQEFDRDQYTGMMVEERRSNANEGDLNDFVTSPGHYKGGSELKKVDLSLEEKEEGCDASGAAFTPTLAGSDDSVGLRTTQTEKAEYPSIEKKDNVGEHDSSSSIPCPSTSDSGKLQRENTQGENAFESARDLSLVLEQIQTLANLGVEGGESSNVKDGQRQLLRFPDDIDDKLHPLLGDVLRHLSDALGACSNATKATFITCPGALKGLVILLGMDCEPHLQHEAMQVFKHLAAVEDIEVKMEIIDHPGVLTGLLILLAQDIYPDLQLEAARVLSCLAAGGNSEIRTKIVDDPGALQGLAISLAKSNNFCLQRNVLYTLWCLASIDDKTENKIADHIYATMASPQCEWTPPQESSRGRRRREELESKFKDEVNSKFRWQKLLMRNLWTRNVPIEPKSGPEYSERKGETKQKRDWTELTNVLKGALNERAGQKDLVNLTSTKQKALKDSREVRFSRHQQTVLLLSKLWYDVNLHSDGSSKENTLLALCDLSEAPLEQKTTSYIVQHDVALLGLECFLSVYGPNESIPLGLLTVLRNMAAGDWEMKAKISHDEHLLRRLVKSISDTDERLLRRSVRSSTKINLALVAAQALGSLAEGDDYTKVELLNCLISCGPGQWIRGLLTNFNRPVLQEIAVQAVASLSAGDEHSRAIKAAGTFKLLWNVVQSGRNPGLQAKAIFALNNLGVEHIAQDPGILVRLVRALTQVGNPLLQDTAAAIMCRLTMRDDQMKVKILDCPGAVQGLLTLSGDDTNPGRQEQASLALKTLLAGDENSRRTFLEHPGALEWSVTSSTMKGSEFSNNLRLGGANVWSSTSQSSHNQATMPKELRPVALADRGATASKEDHTIFSYHEAIEGLVGSLVSGNPALQENAACALYNLAADDEEIKTKIRDLPGALEGFVSLLTSNNMYSPPGTRIDDTLGHLGHSRVSDPNLPERVAALALRILAAGHRKVKAKIFGQLGALDRLVFSLTSYENANAALALGILAADDNETAAEIVSHPKAIAGLVLALTMNDSPPTLLQNAAFTLGALAGADDKTKATLAGHSGVLVALAVALTQDRNPTLQQNAAYALGNLAAGDAKTKTRIVDTPGVLKGLVDSLSKDANPALQKNAAKAVRIIATGDDEIKAKIVAHPGALRRLVNSLVKHDNVAMQGHVSFALRNLAASCSTETKAKDVHEVRTFIADMRSMTGSVKYYRDLFSYRGDDGSRSRSVLQSLLEVLEADDHDTKFDAEGKGGNVPSPPTFENLSRTFNATEPLPGDKLKKMNVRNEEEEEDLSTEEEDFSSEEEEEEE